MNKLELLLGALRHGEESLERDLRELSERHVADHDVFHLALVLAGWSEAHLDLLAGHGSEGSEAANPFAATTVRLPDQDGDAGLVLLSELQAIHLAATNVAVLWEIAEQTAQARRDDKLLQVARDCRTETIRQAAWANSKIKESSPQIMAS